LEGRPVNSDEPIFTPHDFLNYVASVRGVDVKAFQIPSRMIIVYQQRHFDLIDRLVGGKPVEWWWYGDRLRMHVGSFNCVEIVVAANFVGSPAAAMVFEELIACGARKVFEVGLSGGLQPFLRPGDIVVATEAICDEGTTCQYLPNHEDLLSSPSLKRLLIEALNEKRIRHHAGSVLTTDGIYRETRDKLAKFRETGVLAIDMETSALYAVAKHRDVEIASALVVSDLLTESGWRPAFRDRRVLSSTKILMQLAVEVASKT
jgi:uridine phosphorylase